MFRIVGGILILALAVPALAAESKAKPATPTEQYQALVKEYQEARQAYFKGFQAAKSDEEKQRLITEKYPQPAKFAPKFLELAEKHPKDPAAADALIWILQESYGNDSADERRRAKAAAILVTNHIQSKKLAEMLPRLVYTLSPSTEKVLRAMSEKTQDREINGRACFTLAQYLKGLSEHVRRLKQQPDFFRRVEKEYDPALLKYFQQNPDKLAQEAEALFQRVIDRYADIKRFWNAPSELAKLTIGKAAHSALFEMRYLVIGKVAPDIEGEDQDGKKFKLSDYRGKVVMLDFWSQY